MNETSLVEAGFDRLNGKQKKAAEAVAEGWDADDASFVFPIVEGPPGTGKTTVGVLGVAKHLQNNPRSQTAYLAFTNFAAEKAREEFEKLGLGPDTVFRLTKDPRETDWTKGILGSRSSDLKDSHIGPNDIRRVRKAHVLISTLQSSRRVFNVFRNPTIVVDEFSQVPPHLFFSTVSIISATTRYNPAGFALLGDPDQLPVITTQPLLRPNVGTFLLTRKRTYDPHSLELQYRMHEDICKAVNALREVLNTYPLDTHPDVKERTLVDLGYEYDSSGIPASLDEIFQPDTPLVIIDTDSLPGRDQTGFGNSTLYPEEAKLTSRLAEMMYDCMKPTSDEAHILPQVLSPYAAQIGAVQSELRNSAIQNQCTTIYKSQGREYPAVIITFARKNPERKIGFLSEPELKAQTYVGCSRAMAKLVLLFSFSTFSGYPDFATLIKRCEKSALLLSAGEIQKAIG